MLIISIFLFVTQLLTHIRNFIFIEFTAINLYLVIFNDKYNIHRFVLFKENYFERTVRILLKNTGDKYMFIRKYIQMFIKILERYLHLVLIIFCFLFDVIFNNLVLTKIYYVFPIAYLYFLWRLFLKFLLDKEESFDVHLHNLLYHKNPIVLEDIDDITLYINKGFSLKGYNLPDKVPDVYMLKEPLKVEYG